VISFTWLSESKELSVATMTPVVLSEQRTRVARFDQLQPDCTADVPLVVLTRQPAKGKIEFEEEMAFSLYAKNTPQSKCNDERTLGVAVFYTSVANFKGTDRFEVEVFYTTYAVSQKVRFTATVK
jgi:hypothetical protein